jgi:hypothetical protein
MRKILVHQRHSLQMHQRHSQQIQQQLNQQTQQQLRQQIRQPSRQIRRLHNPQPLQNNPQVRNRQTRNQQTHSQQTQQQPSPAMELISKLVRGKSQQVRERDQVKKIQLLRMRKEGHFENDM